MLPKDNKYVCKHCYILAKKSKFINQCVWNLVVFIRMSSGLEMHTSTLGTQATIVNSQSLWVVWIKLTEKDISDYFSTNISVDSDTLFLSFSINPAIWNIPVTMVS